MDTQHYYPARTEVFQKIKTDQRNRLIANIGAAKDLIQKTDNIITRTSLRNHVVNMEAELEEMKQNDRVPTGNVYKVRHLINWMNTRKTNKGKA